MKRSAPYPTFRYWLNDDSEERLPISADGLSSNALPSDGQVLIGSTGNTPVAATLTAGTNVSIANAPGSITINADQAVPALTDGQLLIGSTGNQPVAATLTTGNGISVTNAPGSVTISQDPQAHGCLYWSDNVTVTTPSPGLFVKVAGTSTAKPQLNDTLIGNNRITYTGLDTKDFVITATISATCESNDRDHVFKFMKNSTIEDPVQITRSLKTDKPGSMGLQTCITLSTNDYIELFVRNIENTNTCTVVDLCIRMESIH